MSMVLCLCTPEHTGLHVCIELCGRYMVVCMYVYGCVGVDCNHEVPQEQITLRTDALLANSRHNIIVMLCAPKFLKLINKSYVPGCLITFLGA